MASSYPLGPFKLVSVNTVPERAKRLIGRMVEDVKEKYIIIHVANAEKLEDVTTVVKQHMPDLLFTASMWTPEESQKIQEMARDIVGPQLKTFAIPQGLQVKEGPDAVVAYIKENLPGLLEAK
ncbi:hypothetical protein NA57DRAFT_35747 [Rhizodiscina lignyota]|uniref:Uncharacterized protein n=1 Tax=Rhizodiscina lignyota TaxID=1504668 RepID=A0A9P4IN80_9PEZI|nr:hypothetical protein NA57DRAFT_35747 [Rhizodiscina lignyota]